MKRARKPTVDPEVVELLASTRPNRYSYLSAEERALLAADRFDNMIEVVRVFAGGSFLPKDWPTLREGILSAVLRIDQILDFKEKR